MSERDEAIQKLSQLQEQTSLGESEALAQLSDQLADDVGEYQVGAIGKVIGRQLGSWLGRYVGEALGQRVAG